MKDSQTFFKSAKNERVEGLNETPLHRLVRNCTESDLKEFIEQQGEEPTKSMACMTNSLGQIPLDIVADRKDQDALRKALIELSLPKCKPLSTLFRSDQILSLYALGNDASLNKLLVIACDIGNYVRTVIKESSTHPQTNFYTKEEKLRLHQEMQNDDFDNLLAINPDNWKESIQRKLNSGQANDTGCCKLAIYALREHYPNTSAQLLKLGKSNRTFLIIQPERGEEAVILDPWLGQICLYSERYTLLDYRRAETEHGFCNLLTTINPQYDNFEMANKTHELITDTLNYLLLLLWLFYMGYHYYNELTEPDDHCPMEETTLLQYQLP